MPRNAAPRPSEETHAARDRQVLSSQGCNIRRPKSNPVSTRAGYLTPIASPPNAPATSAAVIDRRLVSRAHATMAADPNAARATSFSGAAMPLLTAGTSRATSPAHDARRPRLGRARAVTLAAKTSPSTHWMQRHATGPRNSRARA